MKRTDEHGRQLYQVQVFYNDKWNTIHGKNNTNLLLAQAEEKQRELIRYLLPSKVRILEQ